MPIRTFYVDRISSYPVKGGHLKHQIYPMGSQEPVETLSALKASIADRSRHLKVPITVGLRETKWGLDIVTIALVTSPHDHG